MNIGGGRETADTLYDLQARTLAGAEQSLSAYRGQVVLIVNVASHCGFTPQYEGLEHLYRRYRDLGLVVLGFPCNQFGAQEPGTSADIQTFCRQTYDVTFPMFAKIDVNGPAADPLFRWLAARATGLFGTRAIKWNFTKFLVDRSGRVVRRYAPRVRPEALARPVEDALAAS